MSNWMHVVFGVGAIWLMFFIWIKVSQRHQDAMRDVDPCRLKSGCAHCTQNCNEREKT